MIIKAITLHQPWASFIIDGIKQYETRAWHVNYRGHLAIHAAKFIPQIDFNTKRESNLFHSLVEKIDSSPTGAILGIVKLLDIQKINFSTIDKLSANEKVIGNWGLGRYAWKLDSPIKLPQPIPATGHQGLWNWEVPAEWEHLLND
jgi:predicted transcriptional regulator